MRGRFPAARSLAITQQINTAAERIATLRGWRRFALAVLLGILSALAFAPYNAAPILWIVYPILLWELNGVSSHRQAFLIGWAFGFGQFVFGFYWISVSMFTDIARWWWAVPFASTALPALFALNTGFAALLWRRARIAGVRRVLLFAAWMMIAEWTRGHLFTGFPWNITGDVWVAYLPLLQSFSFLGGYGLGLITIAAATMPSLFGTQDYPARKAALASAAGIAVIALLTLWGWMRVPTGLVASVPDTVVRLVQPNVPEGEKQNHNSDDDRFETLLQMSAHKKPGAQPTIVVWPETALPYKYMLDRSPQIPQAIVSVLPTGKSGFVLAGSVRRDRGKDGDWQYYNSLQAIDRQGHLIGHYDKTHLVPYGEYMPFREILHLDAMAVGPDLAPGNGPVTLAAPSLPPVSPMICYEAIFPEQVADNANRPQWLLQITNDAWFGNSSGPYQHFAMARARAVEQGLPLLRAANTGISGAVDPFGRVLVSLPIGIQGVIDIALPQALAAPPFYARHGDLLFLLMLSSIFMVSSLLLQRAVGKFFLN